jgi:hypothetical protein
MIILKQNILIIYVAILIAVKCGQYAYFFLSDKKFLEINSSSE